MTISTRTRRCEWLNPSSYPVLLPHFTVQGQQLCFGQSYYKGISHEESTFIALCTGDNRFEDIVRGHQNFVSFGAKARYLAWWDEPLPPGRTIEPPSAGGSPKLLLSPHPDDVELSMGGHAIRQRNTACYYHLICFSSLIYSLYARAFADHVGVTCIRRDEAVLTANMLHLMTPVFLDFPESMIRSAMCEPRDLQYNETTMQRSVRAAIQKVIGETQPDEVYAPAAIGSHPDHQMLFNIVLEFINEEVYPHIVFHLYEDLPYNATCQNIDDFLSRFESSSVKLKPWFVDISDVLLRKKALIEVFRSQFKRPILDLVSDIAGRTGRLYDPDGASAVAAERFWTLVPDPSGMG